MLRGHGVRHAEVLVADHGALHRRGQRDSLLGVLPVSSSREMDCQSIANLTKKMTVSPVVHLQIELPQLDGLQIHGVEVLTVVLQSMVS